jgi:hypothetical protein
MLLTIVLQVLDLDPEALSPKNQTGQLQQTKLKSYAHVTEGILHICGSGWFERWITLYIAYLPKKPRCGPFLLKRDRYALPH